MREDGKLAERKKRENRRWWIALELRETEKSYVKVLEEIDTVSLSDTKMLCETDRSLLPALLPAFAQFCRHTIIRLGAP